MLWIELGSTIIYRLAELNWIELELLPSLLLTSSSISSGDVDIEYSRNSLGYKAKFLQLTSSITLLKEIMGCYIGFVITTSVYLPKSTINHKNTAKTLRMEKDIILYFLEKNKTENSVSIHSGRFPCFVLFFTETLQIWVKFKSIFFFIVL